MNRVSIFASPNDVTFFHFVYAKSDPYAWLCPFISFNKLSAVHHCTFHHDIILLYHEQQSSICCFVQLSETLVKYVHDHDGATVIHIYWCTGSHVFYLSLSLGRLASWNTHSSQLLKSFQNCLPAYTIISLFD